MQEPQYQHLRQHTDQGILVLTFTGQLLHSEAVQEALAAVTSAGSSKVVLDCQAVRFLVSGSLYPEGEPFQPLLALQRQLKGAGGRLVLCNLDPAVEEVFRVTRLNAIFQVQPDVAAAVDSLKE